MSFVSKSKTKFAPKIRKRTVPLKPFSVSAPEAISVTARETISNTEDLTSTSPSISPSPAPITVESAAEIKSNTNSGTLNRTDASEERDGSLFDVIDAPESFLVESEKPKKKMKTVVKSHIIKAPDSSEVLKLMSSTSRRSSLSSNTSRTRDLGRSRRLSSISRIDKSISKPKLGPARITATKQRSNSSAGARKIIIPEHHRSNSRIVPLSSIVANTEHASPEAEPFGSNENGSEDEYASEMATPSNDSRYDEFVKFVRSKRSWVNFKSRPNKVVKQEDEEKDNDLLELAGESKSVEESGREPKNKTFVEEDAAAVDQDNLVSENVAKDTEKGEEEHHLSEKAKQSNKNEKASDAKNNGDDNKEANDKENQGEVEAVEDLSATDLLQYSDDIKIVVDPITKKLRGVKKEDYEKFGDFFDKVNKIDSIKQFPRGINSLDHQFMKEFEINSDSFTMADLCAPSLPIGEVSQDFRLAKSAEKKRKEQAKRRRFLRQKAREVGIPYEELLRQEEYPLDFEQKRQAEVDKLFETPPAQQQNPQLSLAEGNFVIDAESQLVDTRRNLNNDNRPREVENQNPYENPIHSKSFGKNISSDRWTFEETIKFYRALSTWGTDFAVISNLFPHRTRRSVKSKFSLEEKKNLYLIEMALQKKLPTNFDKYVDTINEKKDESERRKFQSLKEFNKELENERDKHKENLRLIREEQRKAKDEDIQSMKEKEEKRKKRGERHLSEKDQRIKALRAGEEVIGEIK